MILATKIEVRADFEGESFDGAKYCLLSLDLDHTKGLSFSQHKVTLLMTAVHPQFFKFH